MVLPPADAVDWATRLIRPGDEQILGWQPAHAEAAARAASRDRSFPCGRGRLSLLPSIAGLQATAAGASAGTFVQYQTRPGRVTLSATIDVAAGARLWIK
jgi:hypothetical protein